ncbi:MAG: translation initiation factor IF-2 [Myxococcota bacterium]
MANIRAYKLAEELGIDRGQFVEKAASVGITLKSAMAQVPDEEAELLRKKLGTKTRGHDVMESRVVAGGGAVIRRRKRKVEPAPEPAVQVVEAVSPESISETEVPATPSETVEPASGSTETEPGPEPELEQPAPIAATADVTTPETTPRAKPAGTAAGTAKDRDKERGAADPKAGKQRKLVREVVNLQEQERLARQATSRTQLRRPVQIDPRSMQSPRRKRRDALPVKKPAVAAKEVQKVVRIEGSVSVSDLARMLGAKAPEVQRKLMALGTMVSINQAIDLPTASQVSAEFGYEVEDVGFQEGEFIQAGANADEANVRARPPVVTVMGHVDHGKTTLLDAIRNQNVVDSEAGGITQHLGAYQVEVGGKVLAIIDTPGHAAFTDMRARGANVTDIVILVIAATDGIMPQTVEAIEHSKAAGVPIIVAVNKCDLPGANSQAARTRLMEHDLVPEEFGGETICVDISALKKEGLSKLLEMVSLQAELLELTADSKRRASGVVLESRLDKGRGPVATILVQEGTLKHGDNFVVGICSGRIRAIENEFGKRLKSAGPSMPVQLIGLSGVPECGEPFNAVKDERAAKEIIDHRLSELRKEPSAGPATFTLDEFFERMDGVGTKELGIIVKGDVHGSVGAITDSLAKLSTDGVKVNVVLSGVGAITKDDVMLAKASNAIVLGFNVRPDPSGRNAAAEQGVDIRSYRIIYELIDEVKQAMAGLLPPTVTETIGGRAEIRETFAVPKVGTIAGSFVVEGSIRRGALCRLIRDGVEVFPGRVSSLKRFKDDAREVNNGFECGIGIEGYNDVKIGDIIETYALEEKPATLE